MKVGIGSSNEGDAFVSGEKIAKQAVENGKIDKATFALAFCSSGVNAENLLRGIKEVIGENTPVIGGSGIGVITNDTISYGKCTAGIALIEDNNLRIQTAYAEGLDKDVHQVGRNLADYFECNPDDKFLLFYDSIKKPPSEGLPPLVNSSKPLLEGMEERITTNIPIIGGGTMSDFEFSSTIQFVGDRVASQSAVGIVLRGDIQMDWAIMHGCSPKDGIYYTITKIEGPCIYEIDNQPIVECINEMYGNTDWQKQIPVKRLTIGINHGEKFASQYHEADYVNRLITGVLPDKSGIVIFEPDLEPGMKIQFMLRDSKTMIESARKNTQLVMDRVKKSGKKPEWGFYIDCGGRTAAFSDSLTEEAQEVQDIFNMYNVPLFGFYSGVEIAPFINKSRGLDWTGVLAVFSK